MFNTDLSSNQDKKKNSRSKLIKSCPNNRYYRRVIIKHAKSSEGWCGPVKEREGHKSRDTFFKNKSPNFSIFRNFSTSWYAMFNLLQQGVLFGGESHDCTSRGDWKVLPAVSKEKGVWLGRHKGSWCENRYKNSTVNHVPDIMVSIVRTFHSFVPCRKGPFVTSFPVPKVLPMCLYIIFH